MGVPKKVLQGGGRVKLQGVVRKAIHASSQGAAGQKTANHRAHLAPRALWELRLQNFKKCAALGRYFRVIQEK